VRTVGRRACLLVVVLLGCLGGCSAPARRADELAARAGFTRLLLAGGRFHHVAYARIGSGSRLLIFVEGDGTPWIDSGRVVASDPTPRHALALELAAQSHTQSVLYLGRPCYLGLAKSPECRPAYWTFLRYSPEVVQSLVQAANRFIGEHAFRTVVLIGHSGGGTLAVLMAPSVVRLTAVVTIAGNLNVRAWTNYHRYLPLTGSLDPTLEPALPAQIREVDLVGGADRNIPPALLQGYLAAHPAAKVWTYPDFGHRCCWLDAWPALLPKLLGSVNEPDGRGTQ
jgi:hypothetical protein